MQSVTLMRLIKVTVLWDVNTMQSGRYVPAFWRNPLLLYSIREETASSVLLGARDFLFSRTFRPALFNILNLFNRSSLGIATRYRLDGPGIESWWGRDFPYPTRPALGPTKPPIRWVVGLSQG